MCHVAHTQLTTQRQSATTGDQIARPPHKGSDAWQKRYTLTTTQRRRGLARTDWKIRPTIGQEAGRACASIFLPGDLESLGKELHTCCPGKRRPSASSGKRRLQETADKPLP